MLINKHPIIRAMPITSIIYTNVFIAPNMRNIVFIIPLLIQTNKMPLYQV